MWHFRYLLKDLATPYEGMLLYPGTLLVLAPRTLKSGNAQCFVGGTLHHFACHWQIDPMVAAGPRSGSRGALDVTPPPRELPPLLKEPMGPTRVNICLCIVRYWFTHDNSPPMSLNAKPTRFKNKSFHICRHMPIGAEPPLILEEGRASCA
jgi:hypothetical protein